MAEEASAVAVRSKQRSTARSEGPADVEAPAPSGCRPFRMTEAEIADYDGPYEYWDAKTGVAWEVRDASVHHDETCTRIVEVVKDIAKMRGKAIAMFGTADLQERDARGTRLVAARPDQSIYLDRPNHFPGNVIIIGRVRLPDVVLEVDLTTDIRDRKLALYAAWGISELWVEVPDAPMPSKRKPPGMTIHILEDGQYRRCAESAAFPTWTAPEIHRALNEAYSSTATVGALRRVGEAMGREFGPGPENDPFLEAERRSSRLAGLNEGRAEGRAAGSLEERLSMLEDLLKARNVPVRQLPDVADRIAVVSRQELVRTALACADFDDFLQRLPVRG